MKIDKHDTDIQKSTKMNPTTTNLLFKTAGSFIFKIIK